MKLVWTVKFLTALCIGLCFLAQPVFAGSCYCAGDRKDAFFDMCRSQSSQAAQFVNDIKNIGDCEKLQNDINNDVGSFSYNKNDDKNFRCYFSQSDTCQEPYSYQGTLYSISDKLCKINFDCSSYGKNFFCGRIGKADFVNAAVTGDQYCFLDEAGITTYKNTPRLSSDVSLIPFTSRQTDLQKPTLEIHIPGVDFTDVAKTLDSQGYIHLPWIGEYIAGIYKFLLGTASILAVFMIIINGARIVVSAGGESQQAAYHHIGQVVVGLVILWGSYLILNTINPELTKFQALKISYITPLPLPPEEPTVETLTGTSAQPSSDGYCIDISTLGSIVSIPKVNAKASINLIAKNLIAPLTNAATLASQTIDPKTGARFDGLMVISAVRTLDRQDALYQQALKQYGSEEAARSHVGKPQGCSAGSSHLTGQAMDIHLMLDGKELKADEMDEARINAFQDNIMTPAGFVRYCPEWWHFELSPSSKPLRSTKCDRPYGTGNSKLKT